MKTQIQFSTNDTLNDLAKRTVHLGYTIISVAEPQNYMSFCRETPQHWFVVWYLQYDRYSYSGSRSYIPQTHYGSWQNVFDARYEVGIDEVMLIERMGLNWEIKQYKSLSDYMSRHTWQNQLVTDKDWTTIYLKK